MKLECYFTGTIVRSISNQYPIYICFLIVTSNFESHGKENFLKTKDPSVSSVSWGKYMRGFYKIDHYLVSLPAILFQKKNVVLCQAVLLLSNH